MNHIELLIRMLPWLVAHPGVPPETVAEEFGISAKEVLRLLDVLQYTGPGQYGGELVDVHFGADQGIYVMDAQKFDRPVRLTGAEASALLAGLTYLEQMPALADSTEVAILIDKISAALNPEPTVSIVTDVREHDCIQLLKSAIDAEVQVEISYASGSSLNASQRVIEPKRLLTRDDRTYVRAWCTEAEAMRTFRVDRIARASLSDLPQVVDINDQELVRDVTSWIDVILELDKEFLGDFDNDTVSSIHELDERRIRVSTKVANLEWLASVVLSAGGAITVVSPEEARDLVVSAASRWLE